MSKIIVPLHFAKLTTAPNNVETGFKKFYLRGEWFKLYNGASEIDVVLDRPLDNYVPKIGTITSSDTVLTAIEKLDYAIGNINPNVLWGSITGNILAQTDLIAYIAALPTSTLQQVTNAGNVTTFDIYANSFYTNTGYALMDDGTAIVDNVQFGSSLSYIEYNGAGFNVWQLPNQTGTIALTSDIGSWGALNYPTWTTGTPFVTMTAAGTFALDTTTYYPYPTGTVSQYIDGTGAFQTFPTILPDLLTEQTIDAYIGSRLKPTNPLSNGFYFSRNANESVGYTAINTNTGNAAVASHGVSIDSNSYIKNVLVAKFGPNYFSSILAGKGGLLGTEEVFVGSTDGNDVSILTGASYNTLTRKFTVKANGQLQIQTIPTTGTTSDFILLRDTSGNVKQIAGNTYVTTANATLQNAYNNSTDGKILLDLTRGAVKVQAIAGTVNTIESNAVAGNLVFYVDSVGNVIGQYIYASWFNTDFGKGLQDNSGTVQFKSAYDGIAGQGRWESNQRINYLADYSALYSNRSLIDKGYADTTYVPKTRTLTINGTSYDLSADRTWTITTGVTSVTATSPITSSGGATPVISTSMTTNKLIGRSTAGTGVMEEITVGTGLSLSGGTLSSSGGIPHGIAAGTDTYTVTIAGVTAYAEGDAYIIRFTNGNTQTCTLNINGLGARTLYRNNDGVLIGGDIIANGDMLCVYDTSLPGFRVIGTAPNTLLGYITNDDSVTITKGQAVYAFGGTGDRMTVKLANNTSDATSARTVGLVVSTSIAANQKGLIMMQGLLDGLSILPTATWADGDPVYLGATPGSITKIKPYAPAHLVYLGTVTTASPGAAGRMYVNIQNGYELDELHNVQAQSPSLNDTLWYDNTVTPAQWKTASIPAILGYTPPNLGLVQAMTQGLQNIF